MDELGTPRLFEAPPLMDHKSFQKVVSDGFEEQGWLWMHVRALRTPDGRWLTGTTSPGFPDLLALRGGWTVACEIKVPPDKPSPEQIEWLTAFQAAGALAWVCRPRDSWTLLARWIMRPETAPDRWGW